MENEKKEWKLRTWLERMIIIMYLQIGNAKKYLNHFFTGENYFRDTSDGKIIALHPGYITSRTDCEKHWVSAHELWILYHLKGRDIIIWDDNSPATFRGRIFKDYSHLYPQESGMYYLPFKRYWSLKGLFRFKSALYPEDQKMLIPRWYRFAYSDYKTAVEFYWLIPFCYIVRALRAIWKSYYVTAMKLKKAGYLTIKEGDRIPRYWFLKLHRKDYDEDVHRHGHYGKGD